MILAFIFIGILLLVGVIIVSRWFASAKPSRVLILTKWFFIIACVAVAIFLAVTGKVYFSILPIVLSIVPSLVRAGMTNIEQDEKDAEESINKIYRGDMSLDEAYEILGLQPGASHKEVKDAHKELLKIIHPDRGGSKYLASQINRAKEIIIGK